MVDCSHANSSKQHEKQLDVAKDVASQISAGGRCIFGVMVESNLQEGRQDLGRVLGRLPHSRTLREDLDRRRADGHAGLERGDQFAATADMRADVHYTKTTSHARDRRMEPHD